MPPRSIPRLIADVTAGRADRQRWWRKALRFSAPSTASIIGAGWSERGIPCGTPVVDPASSWHASRLRPARRRIGSGDRPLDKALPNDGAPRTFRPADSLRLPGSAEVRSQRTTCRCRLATERELPRGFSREDDVPRRSGRALTGDVASPDRHDQRHGFDFVVVNGETPPAVRHHERSSGAPRCRSRCGTTATVRTSARRDLAGRQGRFLRRSKPGTRPRRQLFAAATGPLPRRKVMAPSSCPPSTTLAAVAARSAPAPRTAGTPSCRHARRENSENRHGIS